MSPEKKKTREISPARTHKKEWLGRGGKRLDRKRLSRLAILWENGRGVKGGRKGKGALYLRDDSA